MLSNYRLRMTPVSYRRPSHLAGIATILTVALFAAAGADNSVPAPTVTGFSPAGGPVGTSVVVKGNHLSEATQLSFNGTLAAGFHYSSARGGLVAAVPAGATTGPISLSGPGGTGTSSASFIVGDSVVNSTEPAPTITGFSPVNGPPGTLVVIKGNHLSLVTAVLFNGKPAVKFGYSVSLKGLVAPVPDGASTGLITLVGPGGKGISTGEFTVTAAAG